MGIKSVFRVSTSTQGGLHVSGSVSFDVSNPRSTRGYRGLSRTVLVASLQFQFTRFSSKKGKPGDTTCKR